MGKVRQVVQEPETTTEPEVEPENVWKPPDAEGWQPPFHPLPLCAWVPPDKRFKLPYVKVVDGKYEENNCDHRPCPCNEAKRYAVEKPENVWHGPKDDGSAG